MIGAVYSLQGILCFCAYQIPRNQIRDIKTLHLKIYSPTYCWDIYYFISRLIPKEGRSCYNVIVMAVPSGNNTKEFGTQGAFQQLYVP